ncbi:MAG: hypothetical protein ABIH25_05290 [Candidatus Woesearchaeota archaeon]
MKKRGISPLISWVLLISFAIAMALLVTKWVIDNVENIDIGDEEYYCDDVSISIKNVCIVVEGGGNTGDIEIKMKNNGNFKITRLSLGRETTEKPEEWCLKLNVQNLNPGQENEPPYYLTIGPMSENLIGNDTTVYQNCDEVEQVYNPEDEKVMSVAVVPWIEIEDKSIACISKKVEIDGIVPDCL